MKSEKQKKPETPKKVKYISTQLLDDVFSDEVAMFKPHFKIDYASYKVRLWESNPDIESLLKKASGLEEARDLLYAYLERSERRVFDVDNDLHILEKSTVREAIRVLRSIIGPINEMRTKFSALQCLWKMAHDQEAELESQVSVGFLMEFINLFRGITGKSNIYLENTPVKKGIPDFLKLKGRQAAKARVEILDELGSTIKKYLRKYPSGLDDDVIQWRKENRHRILKYFKGTEEDWGNYQWHIKHVIKDLKPIADLIELSHEQKEAIEKTSNNKIAFGITPYYLSLMDARLAIGFDHAIRAQVIPPKQYVDILSENRADQGISFDFMGEHDTSPIDLVTRRYPHIAIIKPFNTCAQICVYCQRNWEIERVLEPKALAPKEKLDAALEWFDAHQSIGDVLITGGDPMVMKDDQLEYLINKLSQKAQIYRIRIGTRTPVALPMRITDAFMEMICKYHQLPKLEIAFVTHFEHSYEITPEAFEAIQKIRKAGISVYNQQVYTIENSRRFELAKLRRDLKAIGVDPYYTFNMKGKEETSQYMVPIARILQERKEEARLLPGLDRTDEPVFNVPKLGKNHLRAGQDHRLVMILADGSRVYEFHPGKKTSRRSPL